MDFFFHPRDLNLLQFFLIMLMQLSKNYLFLESYDYKLLDQGKYKLLLNMLSQNEYVGPYSVWLHKIETMFNV